MIKKLFTILSIALFGVTAAQAQAPAFPGAEGHGRYVTGGRGGKVIHVTNLNDSGTGSLRAAVSGSAKKIVVFDVGGVIALKSNLSIGDNTTIAGQTAPAPGITLRYYTVRPDANNVIIRFIRIRRGEEKDVDDGADAIWTREKTGMILDHCSFSWSIDEIASFYDMNNYTMQWCTLGESLNDAGHGKGAHGYGGIWGGKLASFHHNMITHVNNRSPRFCGARYEWSGYKNNLLYSTYQWANHVQSENVDFRNCVIYNWAGTGCYGGPGGGQINIVNNYYKPGPSKPTSNNITQVTVGASGNSEGRPKAWGMTSRYYINGNTMTSAGEDAANYDWKGVKYDNGTYTIDGYICSLDTFNYYGDAVPHYNNENGKACVRIKLDEPAPKGEVTTHTAEKAFEKVLNYAGASLNRDEVDARYAQEAKDGTATYTGSVSGKQGIVDRVSDVKGYTEETFGKTMRTDGFDSDNDGMPDLWETANGLNPNDASDANTYTLDSSKQWYTNLEVYLNSLVEDIMKAGNTDATETVDEYYPTCTKVDLSNTVKTLEEGTTPGGGGDVSGDTGSVTWAFNSGTEGQTAVYSEAITSSMGDNSITLGTNLKANGAQKVTVNGNTVNLTKIQAQAPNESEANENNKLTFTFAAKSGYKFKAENVSLYACRCGTDGGKMDISWEDAGGVKVLATAVTPNRNNGDPNYSEYKFNLSSSSQATEGDCKLNINIYALGKEGSLKDYAFGQIIINGKLVDTSGIETPASVMIKQSDFYDLQGRRVSDHAKGVIIRVDRMSNGQKKTSKIVR
ncbi:MAG: pectate lyase [Prevotella sp.]|nr:pectate lyase [Prevotella sp.]MBQ9223440.1 pectate lyase [Prevotella sp.]